MAHAVLVVSAGIFHPPWLGRRRLVRALAQLPEFTFAHASSLEALPRLNMSRFKALVLNIHQEQISPEALEAFDQFVGQGGGLLAVHAATASFKDNSHYFDILGGRFTGHGPVEKMRIEACQTPEGIFDGIPAFSVTDELYLHELHPGVQVEFLATGVNEQAPAVWTYRYDQGRVCYACPGHRAESMAVPAYQALLQRGLRWVCETR